MRIVYIGLKPQKGDNVAATGLTWERGQIHEVEDALKAEKLLKHPLIWANADDKYELLPELAAVEPEPRVRFIPEGKGVSPFSEPITIPIDEETFNKLQSKVLIPVYMTFEDAEAYSDWKIWKESPPPDTAPRNTGPIPKELKVEPESAVDKRTREYRESIGRSKVA